MNSFIILRDSKITLEDIEKLSQILKETYIQAIANDFRFSSVCRWLYSERLMSFTKALDFFKQNI